MYELPAAPTAADDRDQFGRPKAELAFGQLLAVTAYWLAITVLWGAFTFSVIPRLVESDGVLGSSTHPLAGLAIGLITTAGVLIAHRRPADHGRHQRSHPLAARSAASPYILAGTLMDILFLSFAAWSLLERGLLGVRRGGDLAAVLEPELRPGPVPGLHPGPRARASSGRRIGDAGSGQYRRQPAGARPGDPVRGRPPTVLGYPEGHACGCSW